MGSSAALITSLVGALLSVFGRVRLPCDDSSYHASPSSGQESDEVAPTWRESLDLTHNLAQACHCVAQGKVACVSCWHFAIVGSLRRTLPHHTICCPACFTRRVTPCHPVIFLTPSNKCTKVLHHFCFRVCVCQVGSGFDVSAAVYGTHTYTRFSPSVLADALSACDNQASPACSSSLPPANGHPSQSSTIPTPLQRIAKCVEAKGGWDAERGHLRLPPCFRLLMGDVCGGSSTPSMVRKVN